MPSKIFFPTDPEAKLIGNNDSGVIPRLIEQPPERTKLWRIREFDVMFQISGYNFVHIKLPYPSGKWLKVKETWAPDLQGYIYKADGRNRWDCGAKIHWHSPVTMPKPRSRIKFDVVVKQIQSLTMREICSVLGQQYQPFLEEHTETKIATECEFIDHWNSLHAKPVLTKDKKGYMAFPYALTPSVLERYKYVEWGFKHRGELKIVPNPYIAVMAWMKEEIR